MSFKYDWVKIILFKENMNYTNLFYVNIELEIIMWGGGSDF